MRARGSIAMLTMSALVSVPAAGAQKEADSRTAAPPALVLEEGPGARPTVRVSWLDLAGVPAGVEAIARHEVRALMDRMGLDSRWRKARTTEPAREGEVRVVVVDRLLVDSRAGRPILGATMAERREFPVVWVHLPGVRKTLGLPPRNPGASPPIGEIRNVGLGVGRVVAHEIVHVVAPALAHGRGLMAQAFTRAALTGPRLSFEPGVAVVVRASLRGAPVPPSVQAELLAVAGNAALSETGPCEPTGIADAEGPDTELRSNEGHPR